MAEYGELKTMQSGKEIDLNTTVPAMIDFYNSLRQAKTGVIHGSEEIPSDNKRKLNQVRALSLMISTQETLITLASGQVEFRSKQKHAKKNKGKEEKDVEDFDEDTANLINIKYDYNKLIYWGNFLHSCRLAILDAEATKTPEDDFMTIQETEEGQIYRLTKNFWEMLSDLEYCFKSIHQILMVNKVIASGVEENEELSYKEQEALFIERVRDA